MKRENKQFKLNDEPMGHVLTVHLQNLKASGYSTGYLAQYIVNFMPDLTKQVIFEASQKREKRIKLA